MPLALGSPKLLGDIFTSHLSWMVVKKGSTPLYFPGGVTEGRVVTVVFISETYLRK